MKPSVVAVLDVGKTNKKLSAYSRDLEVVAEQRTTLEPNERDGLEVEATDELNAWFRQALKQLAADCDIQAVAITTHGATCAVLDESGGLAYPVISYTSEKGAEIQDAFYEAFGDRETLHRATCTPDLGFANLGKALFYLKTRMPEIWARCRHALFYPAYLGYELTGQRGMEHTYLGNHSYLWDFHEFTWSSVAKGLGADRLFPSSLSNPWERLGTVKPAIAAECGLSPDCPVTIGLHDSNANLLPYLAKGYEDFLLNSTGTWCVAMRQSKTADFTDEEIRAKVLYNLDAFGNPLKTSIFPAGMEYDTFRAFTDARDEADFAALREVVARRDLFVIPGVLPDATAFPGATARVVHEGRESLLADLERDGGKSMAHLGQHYYGALNLSLALATRATLGRCGAQPGTTVLVEGGFANNKSYCALLAALCPDNTIALTNMKEGTSLGAAITGWMVGEGLDLAEVGARFTIETKPIPVEDLGDLGAYSAAFDALVAAH
ncbi:MAG: hypothetical protein JXR94_14010 [Candidatus Hydrogenedentes bacterium]|nr:hypothetical protein [Candidatus Hydrogenedentota bacterium]